jgi:phospholipid/cholesterol/gamma-HCH transport system ATP-binding protein
MAGDDTIVKVQRLKKSFNGTAVLNGIEFTLAKGENLVILGRSGAGKSVLLKTMIRLVDPDSGVIELLGFRVTEIEDEGEMNEMRRRVGLLFQGGALYDSLTVRENLKFAMERKPDRDSPSALDEKVNEALKAVGLQDAINKYPAELSGGMKKRIALARSIILRPELMLYDEPTSGLDPVTSKEISKLMVELQQEYGMSSIIITHDIECAKIASNKIALIRDGKFAARGTFDELKNSDEEWVRAFFE